MASAASLLTDEETMMGDMVKRREMRCSAGFIMVIVLGFGLWVGWDCLHKGLIFLCPGYLLTHSAKQHFNYSSSRTLLSSVRDTV